MHLINNKSFITNNGSDSLENIQSPADIIFLTSADTEITLLSKSLRKIKDRPSVRIQNILNLSDDNTVDTYIKKTLSKAKIVIVRILGGRNYWSYGVDQILADQMKKKYKIIFLPGDDKFDEQLFAMSSIKGNDYRNIWSYFIEGGPENGVNLLKYILYLNNSVKKPPTAKKISSVGIYWPDFNEINAETLETKWRFKKRPVIAITFYSALLQSGQTEVIDALISALGKYYNCIPIYSKSFKDKKNCDVTRYLLKEYNPISVINLTGFSLSGMSSSKTIFDDARRPVFQVILSSMSQHQWQHSSKGLNNRDIIMSISLPEIDGRIITKTIAFKEEVSFDKLTQAKLLEYAPHDFGINYICNLVKNWSKLSLTLNENKNIFICLANYPNKDSRIANGVGLDTPSSVVHLIKKLKKLDYKIIDFPASSDQLMKKLISGQTNSHDKIKLKTNKLLSIIDYKNYFDDLPKNIQNTINKKWGLIENDPFVRGKNIVLPIQKFGNLSLGIQPSRGFNIDPKSSYHSPDLVPPHYYFAFYFWVKYKFKAHAIIQFGKHGNLEWLPGKSLSLSLSCFPDLILGPTPLIYPFIVNDPGEGTQAKRRNAAVIVDHLTPPLTNADTYDELIQIELLLDEYYECYQTDPIRAHNIEHEIIELTQTIGLYSDTLIDETDTTETKLNKIDTYLCELKELQIRDGLHIFGKSPRGQELINLVLSISKTSRKNGLGENKPITQAIADDLGINLSVNECKLSVRYTGDKNNHLQNVLNTAWRTNADTIERLRILSEDILLEKFSVPQKWKNTMSVLNNIKSEIVPSIKISGRKEHAGIVALLDGKFLRPGPSGAPTRGKIEVFPTGKNFYSIDMRSLPTRMAWSIGKRSAELMVADFHRKRGSYPTHFGLSAWGTSNMRTGGDDISQALALIGAKPKWDNISGRVSGYEIIPVNILKRPRIDVTLRISGFFRDAFPNLIDLFDQAIREVALLDEDDSLNPIKCAFDRDRKFFKNKNLSSAEIDRLASYHIFSSMPGSYGAGLQSMIDEGIWKSTSDLAENYINWGSYAYGSDNYGYENKKILTMRLERLEAVIQNQDNREHDILDSDDYYQFHGGMGAAVEKLSGNKPIYYHNDHSNPNNLKIGTLDQEISKIVRGRAANPKWIKSIMKHGYKGAFELLATLDYLYAYQATTGLVKDHHFDLLFESYIVDKNVYEFIKTYNPDALNDIKIKFMDAIERELWHPRRNDTKSLLEIEKEYN